MVLEKTVKDALSDLMNREETTVSVGESNIKMKIFDRATKISFCTPIYRGESYIPPSVRECVNGECPISEELLKSHLILDEETSQIFLQYIAGVENLDKPRFEGLLDDFAHAADIWRDYLGERDERDRIFVRK